MMNLPLNQKFDPCFLGKTPLFKGLPEQDCVEIFKAGQVKYFLKNEILFHQGDRAKEVLIILEGKIKIFQTGEEGDRVLLRVLGPGELVAGVAALEKGAYPGMGVAIEKTTAFALNKKALQRLMAQYSTLSSNMVQLLLERIAELQERLREMFSERVEKRIARALLRFAEHHGVHSEAGCLIDFPITRQDLAEFTGTTLFTVSRLLKAWEAKGLICSGRKKIALPDLERLRKILEE